jgi:hypothetical protein
MQTLFNILLGVLLFVFSDALLVPLVKNFTVHDAAKINITSKTFSFHPLANVCVSDSSTCIAWLIPIS